jgi:hypothetical protein
MSFRARVLDNDSSSGGYLPVASLWHCLRNYKTRQLETKKNNLKLVFVIKSFKT